MFQWLAIHLWHMCRGTLVPLHHFCMDVLFFRCERAQWRCCYSDYWRARSGAPERGTHTHSHTHTDAALQHVTLLCSEAMKDKIPHSQVSERQFTHQFKGRGLRFPKRTRKEVGLIMYFLCFFSFSCSFWSCIALISSAYLQYTVVVLLCR